MSWISKILAKITGEITDDFLETLLDGMKLAFKFMSDYRKNIEGYEANLLFQTRDGTVEAAAMFKDGKMKVDHGVIDDWDVRIIFTTPKDLRDFLFSKDQDIINSLMKNAVDVDGNVNHIYKFGFLAKDLLQRLHLA
jgi:hypothetical protein